VATGACSTRGLEFLEQRTGVPVLGVLPYLRDLRIADEDSVALDDRRERPARAGEVEIAVVRLPRISNYDDFEPLEHEVGVAVRYVTRPGDLETADLVVLPGSKCTVSDLGWLRESGIAATVAARGAQGRPVLGICGGCQMLGTDILDPDRVESAEERVAGLGLLPLATRFLLEKTTAQVRARLASPSLLGERHAEVSGYEIHMGAVGRLDGAMPALEIISRNGTPCREPDGAVAAAGGTVVGTLIHGLFENESVRAALLRSLRARRGLATPQAPAVPTREAEYDRLARSVIENVDWQLLCRIVGIAPSRPSFGSPP
jgi:adenosylcobyric acid synthase